MLKIKTTRTNVTIDDRRAVIVLARGRSNADIVRVPQEDFIRRSLKARLGIAFDQPSPDSLKSAAKELAASLAADKARAEAQEAAKAEAQEAARKAAMGALAGLICAATAPEKVAA